MRRQKLADVTAVATAARPLRIGQLARATGFQARTIRYYETLGLVRPQARTSSGYRLYAPEAIERLRLVRGARGLGLCLADIRAILDAGDSGAVTCEHVLAAVEREIARVSERMQRLRDLRRQLVQVKSNVEAALESGAAAPGCLCPCISNTAP